MVTKRLKTFFPPLVVALAVLVTGIYLLINFNRRKASLQEKADLSPETSVSEDTVVGLPTDFPVFSNVTVESSYSTKGENAQATSIVWKTESSVAEVSNFYDVELKSAGWDVLSNIKGEVSTTFSVEKGNHFGIIGIGRGEGESTVISVTIGLR
jgi:hypothetical protein